MFRKALMAGAIAVAVLWLSNTSLLGARPEAGNIKLLSHRGVHQTFSPEDLENDTCTASRILPPAHEFIENTLPSMQAAFQYGAAVVELDIHLTPDGKFAVFHDWTLDCRTDGTGIAEETLMIRLKELDVGYGYTADGGRTFPLRGKGIGLMPTLDEVLREFPGRKFLINFKSQRLDEAEALAELLQNNPEWRQAIFGVYGGDIPTRESLRLIPGLRGYDKASATNRCL
ncbi:glycerophosphoryl diester phosphodiesterase [Aminobacter sp. J44]|nr:glycerophosphoryl diester phosphodiesterase [Aminobacter sp. J44]